MTTIAWDGRFLAADTRRSSRNSAWRADDTALKLYDCLNTETGNKIPITLTKKASKPTQASSEFLLAMAGAGSRSLIRPAVKYIQTHGWADLIRVGSHATEFLTSASAYHRHATLLAITSTHVRKIVLSESGVVDAARYDRADKIAIGSGSKVASFLMETFKLSAPNAIAGAFLSDPSTGGSIDVFEIKHHTLQIHPTLHLHDRHVCMQQLHARIKAFKPPTDPHPFDRPTILTL